MQSLLSNTLDLLSSRRRLIATIFAILGTLAVFLYVILPIIAATQVVRDRIAFQLGAWSGYRVSIGEPPAVRVFPLRAVLSNVTLTAWPETKAPVMTADRIIIELDAFDALFGDITFAGVRVFKPVLHVSPLAGGIYMPRLPGAGGMANAVKAAKILTAENPANPDVASLPGESFGKLQFTSGRIVADGNGEEIASDVSGSVNWPSLDKPGELTLGATWRTEKINVTVSSTEPMLLLAGGAAQTRLSFSGAPGQATFNGTLNLAGAPYLEGEASFSTTSLQHMLEWSGLSFAPRPDIGAVSIQSHIQGDARHVKFDQVALGMNGSTGTGVAELTLGQPLPMISGTFAMQSLDLTSLVAALAPLSTAPEGSDGAVPALSDSIALDLRLSATQAVAGSFTFSEVAATAQLNQNFAVFDISDAQAFGGALQAGLRMNRGADGVTVETSVRASNVDGAALGLALGLSRLVPASRGNVTISLKGPVDRWSAFANRLQGSVAATFGAGTLSGIDFAKFVQRLGQKGVFSLAEASGNGAALQTMEIRAAIANNLADVAQSFFQTDRNVVRLSGVVSFAGRGLALSGTILDAGAPAAPDNPVAPSFFVGGTWAEPFISPVGAVGTAP